MCSQIACFVHRDLLTEDSDGDQHLNAKEEDKIKLIELNLPYPIEKFEYKLLFKYDFPINVDDRSQEKIILDSVEYFINRYRYAEDIYFNFERDLYEIPVNDIYQCVPETSEIDELRRILLKEFTINQNDCVEVQRPEEISSSEHSLSEPEEILENVFVASEDLW